MTGAEARALKDEEIAVELDRLRGDLLALRSKGVTEKIEDTSRFGEIRKDIARLLTERRARQIGKES